MKKKDNKIALALVRLLVPSDEAERRDFIKKAFPGMHIRSNNGSRKKNVCEGQTPLQV
jgi:hypothetical protein